MRNTIKILSLCLVLALMLSLLGCQTDPQQTQPNETDPVSGEKQINEVTGLKDKPVILFMGDSITDGGRTNYKDKTFLGANHPKIVAQKLRQMFKNEEFIFYSTGVSGDTVLDQYFRLQEDCFDLNPDYIVMLLGINDCWMGSYKNKETFEKSYRFLLDAMIANTDAKIILVQPYLLPADDAMQANCVIANVNGYKATATDIADVVCTMAAEYDLDIIYFAEILEQQHQKGAAYIELASDAIHPTALAATILAEQIILKLGVKGFVPAFGEFDTSEIAAKYNK
ncbi:MAG: hypothetical protein IJ448_01215 [Oscillospiraceae bacterium]|nr:hypothetical protein [Oscillospiraceae bacterium]